MKVTPARIKYWESMKGKPHGHKTNNGMSFKMSEESKEKLRKIALEDGRKPNFSGRKHTEESRRIMSEKRLLNPNKYWLGKSRPFMQTKEYRQKVSEASKKVVEEGRHNFWRGGVTEENKLIRSSSEYKFWRTTVFNRDNYTCQKCGIRGGKLEANHVLPFAYYPDLRFEVLNGETLCKECHKKTDTYGKRSLLSPTNPLAGITG